MKYLETETVLALHRLMTDTVGGAHGLRENFLVLFLSWLLAHVLTVLTLSAFFN